MKLTTKDMILTALFVALMVVGAYIKIPFPIIPLTFQPFFCALAGIFLGARLGLLSQLVYIAMGLLGLPVFSAGGGLSYVVKPSFGYLIGFAIAAYVIGKITEKNGVRIINLLIALFTGLIIIYSIGIGYTFVILKFYLVKTNITLISTTLLLMMAKDLALYIFIAITSTKIVPLVKKATVIN